MSLTAADVRGDHRKSRCGRLDENHGKTFPIRREDENVESGETAGDLSGTERPRELHRAIEPERAAYFLEFGAPHTVADDHAGDVGTHMPCLPDG